MKAQLILENGIRFTGKIFGAEKDVVGEVVFTTGMGGYQETLTDPSIKGQIVTMTFPLVGSYGINLEDMESSKAHLKALVVREKCNYPSNFRNEMTLDDFLKQQGVVGLEDIDTRALTRMLRDNGTMKGIIALGEISEEEAKKRFAVVEANNLVMEVTTKEKYIVNEDGKTKVALIDLGTKKAIIEEFTKRDCSVTVFPANTDSKEIEEINPDLVFVSSGPGNPEDAGFVVETVKNLVGKYKISGICLGNLVIALALGATVEKMTFGHHGGNHPAKDTKNGRVYVTSQGHSHVVTNMPLDVESSFINANDGTSEGIMHKTLPIYSVQFHPEACSGPQETKFIFDTFLKEVK